MWAYEATACPDSADTMRKVDFETEVIVNFVSNLTSLTVSRCCAKIK